MALVVRFGAPVSSGETAVADASSDQSVGERAQPRRAGGTPPGLVAIAGRMRRPSYMSLQSALAYHGVIPESVTTTMSVTTGRPARWETAVGTFRYRHVHPDLFWGYRQVDFGEGGAGHVALPEKALLDLFHFTAGPIRAAFVRELRLEPDTMDGRRLRELAQRAARPKLIRAAVVTARVLDEERQGETVL